MKSKIPKEWIHLIDMESGLYHRPSLIHHLNEAFARARRYQSALSCILFRIRWQKDFDEVAPKNLGSPAPLHKLACVLLLEVREGDIFGRCGPDEFLLITSNTPQSGAEICSRNILHNIAELAFEEKAGGLSVSVHVGVAGIPDASVRYAEDFPLLPRI
jgi:diguanylate cyclase (GGDEF)-like protein